MKRTILLSLLCFVALPAAIVHAQRELPAREPVVTILESDAFHLRGTVRFEPAVLVPITKGSDAYTEVFVPGVPSEIGDPGTPAVPVFRRLISVPPGASISATSSTQIADRFTLNLLPFQKQPVDQSPRPIIPPLTEIFNDLPFIKNTRIYLTDRLYPSQVVSAHILGGVRDQQMAQLEIATGQYNPSRKLLTTFSVVEFNVQFVGGLQGFTTRRALQTIDKASSLAASATLNLEAVKVSELPVLVDPSVLGEEFLILTAPAFRTAADTLAAWRRQTGLSTNVVEVNDGVGPGPDTKETIKALIKSHYDNSVVRPSYILLLGDTDFLPTWYVNAYGSATTGTDYPYAVYDDNVVNKPPSFALGRIPVDTASQATTVVNKIIEYEKNPPTLASFYENALIASQFQCCREGAPNSGTDSRSFIESSGFSRNALVSHGKTVQRVYVRTGSQTPNRYYDGSLLPADLRASSGFAWNGTTADIVNGINQGRFLVIHRDQGWEDGWEHPWFTTNEVNTLTNGSLLPVVISVNCASGFFDAPTANGDYGTSPTGVYFVQALLRKANGGAVGMLGDSRNSPSWPNSALLRGFIDAIWPDAIPTFGANTSYRRLGDILNHGKLYMMTQVGAVNVIASEVRDELYMWHVYGDPAMKIRLSRPFTLASRFANIVDNLQVLTVSVLDADGATVKAYQETPEGMRPIGEGVVANGVAEIPYAEPPLPGISIQFLIDSPDAVPAQLTPRIPVTLTRSMLSALTLGTSSTPGGAGVKGKVTLAGSVPITLPRPTVVTVALKSSNPLVASVPAEVTVPGGQSSVSFEIQTRVVRARTSVTISATLGGVTRTAVLTVSPFFPLLLRRISIGSTEGAAGQTVPVTISTNSALTGYASAQFVVEYPTALGDVIIANTANPVEVSLPDSLLSKPLLAVNPNAGALTVAIVSTTEATAGGRLFQFPFTIDPDVPPGTYPLKLTKVELFTSNTSPVSTLVGDGTLTVRFPVMRGDLNGNRSVDVTDAITALRIAVGMARATESQMTAGDLTGDGKITVADVTRILRIAVGLDRG